MPLYDMHCSKCEHTFEVIAKIDEEVLPCPKCKANSKRIISVSGPNCANDDAGWISSVLEVVDKDSTAPHVVEFRKNPTRENYKNWMKKEGLRHLEPGEETYRKPQEPDMSKIHKEVWEKHRKRNTLEVRSR